MAQGFRGVCSRLCIIAGLLLPAVVRADTAYFVSKTTGGLYSFDTANQAAGITVVSGTGTFDSPSALALGPDGNLYVGDASGGGRIARFTMSNSTVSTVASLSTGTAAYGGPVSPASMTFTPGGKLLVGRNPQSFFAGYPAGAVVEVVDWSGGSATVQNYTTGTTQDFQTGLAVAADGTLYASNTVYNIFVQPAALQGNVVKFNSSGAYQGVTATEGSGGSPGIAGPAGLAVVGTSLYTASTMNGYVYKTDLTNSDPATNTTIFGATGGDYLGPLSALSDGGLLVGSVSGVPGLIYQFNSTGNIVGTFGAAEYGQIGGIAVVPEPSAVVTALIGVAGVAGLLRRRRAA